MALEVVGDQLLNGIIKVGTTTVLKGLVEGEKGQTLHSPSGPVEDDDQYLYTMQKTCSGDLSLDNAAPYGTAKLQFGRYAVTNSGFVWARARPDGYINWSCNGESSRDLLQGNEGLGAEYIRRTWGNKDILLDVRVSAPHTTFSSVMVCDFDTAPVDGFLAMPSTCHPTWNYHVALKARS